MRWVVLAALLVAAPAGAAELRLGLSSSPTSLDPHFHNLGANSNVAQNMFETLVQMDPDSRITPGLAESWRHVDDLTWEFTLRAGAVFHDGAPLTAEDVVWSLDRPATIVNSPAGFVIFTRAIVGKQVVDARTVRLVTAKPYPLLLSDLSAVYIVSKKATTGVPTEAFATGQGVVGTGPYKFVSYARDDRVVMERNPAYWGAKPGWDRASVRFLPNNATRLAALLAGDLDAIEGVPTPDLEAVKANKALVFAQKISHRLIYLYVDERVESPFVTAKDGGKIAKNPMGDVRVRQALSMAINRQAIAERVLGGLGYPTNNLVAETLFGNDPTLKLVAYDPEGAKKKLAEAGYPDGFGITIHGPNNRFVNDAQVVQAIGQMLTRIGIATKVETQPMATYAAQGARSAFSLGLIGFGAQTGESSSTLRAIIMCERQESGGGLFNWSHYCNPKVDQLTERALATVDDAARLSLLQQAAHLAVDEGAILPLYFQATTWAAKKGITIVPRTDERTFAEAFKP
jgi:peptide/nickel transport system substrate-binding protein